VKRQGVQQILQQNPRRKAICCAGKLLPRTRLGSGSGAPAPELPRACQRAITDRSGASSFCAGLASQRWSPRLSSEESHQSSWLSAPRLVAFRIVPVKG
jgi:hypothetical protein